MTVPYNLQDHKGRLFQKAGTRLNPLTYRGLSTPLVFIDGDDSAQVTWASHLPKAKIILVSGSPFDLMETWNKPVYFDQGGRLTMKLGIHHVPTIVAQEGLQLKISEIVVSEEFP